MYTGKQAPPCYTSAVLVCTNPSGPSCKRHAAGTDGSLSFTTELNIKTSQANVNVVSAAEEQKASAIVQFIQVSEDGMQRD